MTILVTGSNGFLGTALVERLAQRGGSTPLRCMVRAGSNRRRLEAVIARYPAAPIEIAVGSLSSPEAAAEILGGVTQVLHLAASLSGAAADMFLSTVVASKNLLEAVRRMDNPAEIVLISSFGVYGVADLPRGTVVDESTPLEPHPARRDLYSQAKLRQEKLFWEYREKYGIPLVVLRPGVIYGPGGSALSNRIGLRLPGVYLHLGRDNALPLTYVDNCAEAIAVAAAAPDREGQIYNVVDDDLVGCATYLRRYRREVEPLRTVKLPYAATLGLAWMNEKYFKLSKGQLPAILTPYKARAAWKGNRFDNTKLKAAGWRPIVSTEEGIRRTFEALAAARGA